MSQSAKLKKVILLAFANHDQAHLSMLKAESQALDVIFQELKDQRSVRLVKMEEAKITSLHQSLREEQQTVIFHYAGHADPEGIHLVDGKGYIQGLAPMLGRLKQLKLVFLNGCATKDQVQFLLDQKVKAVIATRVPVGDQTAYEFSKAFYESFAKGNTLKECYEHACDFLNFKHKDLLTYRINKRSIGPQSSKDIEKEVNWNLFYRDPEVLSFRGVGVETDKIQADSALIQLINRFKHKIPIRILVAVSRHELLPNGTISPLNVYNEVALIKEYIYKLFIYSNLNQRFDLQLYLLKQDQKASLIISSRGEADLEKEIPLPQLASFDLVSWVIWNNLGEADTFQEAPLRLLYRRVFDLDEAERPDMQIFRRGEAIRSFVPQQGTKEQSVITTQAQQVELFFREIAGQRVIDYHPNLFEEEFEHHLRLWLKKLVRRKYQSQPKQDLEPLPAPAFSNPYKGLKPYQYQDANIFFGRINEVDQLRDQLASQEHEGLLAVIGASGSGKSSLVRAGLFNRLKLNTIPGSRKWRVLECVLQENHLECLPFYGEKSLPAEMSLSMQEYMLKGREGATLLIDELMKARPHNSRLVLFFDQFEEVFNLIGQDQEDLRVAILHFLVEFAQSDQGQVVLTMRSEYFHRCLDYPQFAKLLKKGQQVLLPPSRESMIRIIVRPAMFSGLRFDEGLEIQIWEDAFTMGGNLPLVSYVLEQLAEKREDNRLTLKAYEELGGVVGVIQKQADLAIAQFDTDDEAFKHDFNFLFRKLIKVEDGVEGKRPAPLDTSGWPTGAIALKNALIDKRLLFSTDQSLEITHEALIRHWDLLQNWIIDTRAALLMLAKTGKEAADWFSDREQLHSLKEKIALDRNRLWSQARLQSVYEAKSLLGLEDDELDKLYPRTLKFIRPESERLCEELQYSFINHQRRNEIGNRLAELGDPRPGVGLKKGIPEIVWCAVPGGEVQIAAWKKSFAVAPFYIAQYPITLAQFNVFKQNDNYFTDQWWEGLPPNIHRDFKPKIQSPENMLNRPAELVNWYHAVAFCRWLSNTLGYRVRLPYEWEWQQAACHGNPNHNFPWGKEWDPTKANSSAGISTLAAVGLYPQGMAENGAMDLAGNAYEWCYNAFEPGAEGFDKTIKRTTKGGGWGKFDGAPDKVLNNFFRLGDFPHGINERGNDIRVCFRLVAEEIPESAKVYNKTKD